MTIAVNLQTPPAVSGGIPVMGHLIEFMRDRSSVFKRGFEEHGKIFTIKLGPQPCVVLVGEEGHKLFFTETDKRLNMTDAYEHLKVMFGNVLFVADHATYLNQRPMLQQVFRRAKMVAYVEAMRIETEAWLNGLGDSGEMDIAAEMRDLTRNIAGRAFVGKEPRLDQEFWDAYDDIGKALDPVLPPHLPLPKYRRRDRAREKIFSILAPIIQERRQHPDRYDDFLQDFVTTPLKDGSMMSDEDITNLLMGLLFAGHETTAGQAAWTVITLLQHPRYRNLVEQEILDKLPADKTITLEDLPQLAYTFMTIDEVTRKHGSADILLRTADEPIEFGGYLIPEGWRVIVNADTAHFLDDVFTEPEQFDPTRYCPSRNEGSSPYAIMGFGGGMHKCTGMNFAKNEMAVILTMLFKDFDLTLLTPEPETIRGMGATHPGEAVVRYQRKPLSERITSDANYQAAGCPHHE